MNDSPETRLSLLSRVSQNDEQAWNELHATYLPWLLSWGQRSGATLHDAQDACSEVLATLVKIMPTFQYDENGSFRGLLVRIFQQRISDIFEKIKKRGITNQASKFYDIVADKEALDELVDGLMKQEANFKLHIILRQVREKFSDNAWQSWALTQSGEKSGQEVAAKLGIARALVYKNRERVNNELKRRGRELGYEFEDVNGLSL